MTETAPTRRIYRLSSFRLDSSRKFMERDGTVLPLGPRVIDTLTVLVENAGEVVDKETLLRRVWPDANVVESSLTKNICILRKILDDGNHGPSSIQTVARRGYRFVGPIEQEADPNASPVLESPRGARSAVIFVAAGIALLITLAWGWSSRRGAQETFNVSDREYLVGRHIWLKMERSEMLKALDRFERAAELNPKSAFAHAGIADAHVAMTMLALGTPADNLRKARAAAIRAVELDSNLVLPHVSLGFVKLISDFDPTGSEREFRKAIQLDPQSALARFGYGILLSHSGRLDEARTVLANARELDPVSTLVGVESARVEYYARRYSRAVELLNDILYREPASSQAHYYMALSLRAMSRPGEALAHLRQARVTESVLAEDEAWIAAAHDGGAATRKLLAERLRLVAANGAAPDVLLVPAADAGEVPVAISALEQMWKTRELPLLQLKVHPRFDSLRSDPRFQALVQRIWRE